MEWHEFDIDDAECTLQNAQGRVARADGPVRPEYTAKITELEMVIDWYHRFAELDLALLAPNGG